VSLNEEQSQVVTSFFSTDSGPLNVLINEMAGTGKSFLHFASSGLPDDCVMVMAAVAYSVFKCILDVVHVLHAEFPIFALVQKARRAVRVRVCSRVTGAAALLLSSVHGMVQAKVIRVVLELLGGAVAAFCEPQTPPVSLSTTGPEGVIHQLRQHRSCRSCAGARNAVTARLSSGSPKAAHARDSTHGRDSVALRANSALHTCVSSSGVGQTACWRVRVRSPRRGRHGC